MSVFSVCVSVCPLAYLNKRLSYRRETRATLCIIRDVDELRIGLLHIACQSEQHFQQLPHFIPLPA